MSAFQLSDACWQTIADLMHDPGPYGETVAASVLSILHDRAKAADRQTNFSIDWLDLVKSWHEANYRAVASRYGVAVVLPLPRLGPSKAVLDRIEDLSFRTQIRPEDSGRLMGYIKLMQCLVYQCSEEVPASAAGEHAQAMETMMLAIGALGSRLACSLPEYHALPWGDAA